MALPINWLTETFCISAVELQACGLPVVAGANIGLHDTIINKQTGYLVKNDNEFKNAIIYLLKNNDIRNTMSIKAKIFALNRYDFSHIITKWVSLLKILSVNILPANQSIKSKRTPTLQKIQSIRFCLLEKLNIYIPHTRLGIF